MAIEVFLNDLSLPSGAVPLETACGHLRSIVSSLRALKKLNGDVVLNSDLGLNAITLGDGHSVAALRNSQLCVEEGQFLKRLQDRSPFDRVIEAAGGEDFVLTEFKISEAGGDFAGATAKALGLSWALDGVGLSFETHAAWQITPVPLIRYEMDFETGELSELAIDARNITATIGTAPFEAFLRQPPPPAVVDGADLWARRAELFPNLLFLPRVRGQVEALLAGDRVLAAAVRRLGDIDASVGAWAADGTAAPQWTCYMRPESGTRINKGLVDFANADGVTETYSDHADFGPAEGRIHILLKTEPARCAVVGHIGRKLGIG
ncbi:hypothetical protein [Caulobacter sp. Root1472]|uniref:hypothetical protein n=1 Tax=Caulobacter sp. Root1472 TaxID=1736470 RepID=UPI0006FEE5DA|nr:hypothetical protein [Caulobacter sp. Root1472]KQZ26432.1 hypothetical protein ASD47_23125 [Caulobacter sp. Root1472]